MLGFRRGSGWGRGVGTPRFRLVEQKYVYIMMTVFMNNGKIMFYRMPSYSLSLPDSDSCLMEYRTVGDRSFKR